MTNVILNKDTLAEWLRDIMKEAHLIAPIVVGSQAYFRPITAPNDIRWDVFNTTVPPIEYLMPQSEPLFHYEKHGTDVDIAYTVDSQQRVLLGVRPCDVHAIRMMDRVFAGKHPDPYYLTRRHNTTIVAMACNAPAESCFCTSFGTGPSLDVDAGADILVVDLGDHMHLTAHTPQGETLLARSERLFTPATAADAQRVQELNEQAKKKITRTLEVEGLSETLAGMFDSPYWEKIARKCISCGACTYLCPVCYCFDVSESCKRGGANAPVGGGERTRCWDACTFKSFAMLSGGHNPRPSITEGYRQKMYHKFNYAVERYGEPLCVGCGRCMVSCPVNLDIVTILNEAKGGA